MISLTIYYINMEQQKTFNERFEKAIELPINTPLENIELIEKQRVKSFFLQEIEELKGEIRESPQQVYLNKDEVLELINKRFK